jgi:hypothetical protein
MPLTTCTHLGPYEFDRERCRRTVPNLPRTAVLNPAADLRREGGSRLLESGAPEHDVQRVFDHVNLSTRSQYFRTGTACTRCLSSARRAGLARNSKIERGHASHFETAKRRKWFTLRYLQPVISQNGAVAKR